MLLVTDSSSAIILLSAGAKKSPAKMIIFDESEFINLNINDPFVQNQTSVALKLLAQFDTVQVILKLGFGAVFIKKTNLMTVERVRIKLPYVTNFVGRVVENDLISKKLVLDIQSAYLAIGRNQNLPQPPQAHKTGRLILATQYIQKMYKIMSLTADTSVYYSSPGQKAKGAERYKIRSVRVPVKI